MEPMDRLSKGTIDHIREYLASHDITTTEPGTTPWGWSTYITKPKESEKIMVISWSKKWPMIDVSMVGPSHTPFLIDSLDTSEDDLGRLLEIYEKL